MLGMSLLKIIKIGGISALAFSEIISLAVGFIVSFIVALIVVDKFISYLKRKPMRIFAIYRMIFAVIVLVAGFREYFKSCHPCWADQKMEMTNETIFIFDYLSIFDSPQT